MASIEPYETAKGRRYRVRYRRPDGRHTDRRGFRTKREATLFLNTTEVDKAQGTYIDPSAGAVTIADLGKPWLDRQSHLKPSTYTVIRGAWHTHIQPKWGHWKIRDITQTEVEGWVAELSRRRSATVTLRALGVLKGILDGAVKDRLIGRNPAVELTNLPRKGKKEHIYLTHNQVGALSEASGEYRRIVLVGCYMGLRWGEITGLRAKDFDAEKNRLTVAQNVVRVGSKFYPGTPKTHEQRTVAVPAFLVTELQDQVKDRIGDALIFPGTNSGYLMRPKKQIGWWKEAKAAAGVPDAMVPHDMRHTAASLAIQSGAHVKAVQRMLGHASAAMTLDTYSALFDTDLDVVAVALDAARTASR
ncbi:tyrosine-type recombinase/integrase [Brevibacterium sp. CBA3109]|uniref:Tyrosine-type recombinase/integrase n=1 Tax=Brevibacterium koreense TaxID=3140787 RepID=A0AAU7UII3_9MICO